MNRLTFLKLSLVAVAGAVGGTAFPLWAAAASKDVSYGGALYRSGGGGKILTSADRGKSWKLHSDLGDIYSIADLAVDRRSGSLRLSVGFDGSTFPLVLGPDKRAWLTV